MLNLAQVGFLALLVGLFPAQLKQASKMKLERSDDICSHLSPSECCEEMLKLASFRATREHLPEQASRILKIGCSVGKRSLGRGSVCTSLATSRAFSQKEVKRLCAPKQVKRRCTRSKSCQQCTKDLAALDYRGAHPACYAVTYKRRARRSSEHVVTVSGEEPPSRGDATVIVIPKRSRLLP
ncbi:MAG: hypothetical protein OXU20_09700 [Myxococcales bacterium]|nr:hypothetical protein [Myxococcales bacterium]